MQGNLCSYCLKGIIWFPEQNYHYIMQGDWCKTVLYQPDLICR